MRITIAAGLVAVLAGCGTVYGGLPPVRRDEAPGYDEVLERHTRNVRVYDGVERILIATATLEMPAYLEARFLETARIHDRAPEEAGPLMSVYRHRYDDQLSMVLFFDATLPQWEDLEQQNSIWRLVLRAGGRTYEPRKVEELNEEDVTLRHLFPYTNPFGTLYLVVFPVTPEELPEAVELRIAGVPARVALEFVAR